MTSTSLGIFLLEQAQAQKEVTVNEAFQRIDALLRGSALDKDLNTPPGSPAAGDTYIVGASPTGSWSGKALQVAYFDQIWRFVSPVEGMMLWLCDENKSYVYDGSNWQVSGLSGTVAVADGGTGATMARTAVANLQGIYILGASAVASSVTGTTSETALATITVPANAMGTNGRLRITYIMSWTSSGNSKQVRLRFGGVSGLEFQEPATQTTNPSGRYQVEIANRNSASVQVGAAATGTGFGVNSSAPVNGTVNTALAQDIVITGKLNNSGDTITLESYLVELIHG